VKESKRLEEERIEADRLGDIFILLERLMLQEETTARLILDCLYDIGSVNLINRRVSQRSLNGIMKMIARTSKPIFRVIAIRWFRQNCPQLVAKWLYSQVTFEAPTPTLETMAAATAPPEAQPVSTPVPTAPVAAAPDRLSSEIRQLRTQVRVLTGVILGSVVTVSAAIVWMGYGLQLRITSLNAEPARLEQVSSRVLICERDALQ
jgi:hypothetical protein